MLIAWLSGRRRHNHASDAIPQDPQNAYSGEKNVNLAELCQWLSKHTFCPKSASSRRQHHLVVAQNCKCRYNRGWVFTFQQAKRSKANRQRPSQSLVEEHAESSILPPRKQLPAVPPTRPLSSFSATYQWHSPLQSEYEPFNRRVKLSHPDDGNAAASTRRSTANLPNSLRDHSMTLPELYSIFSRNRIDALYRQFPRTPSVQIFGKDAIKVVDQDHNSLVEAHVLQHAAPVTSVLFSHKVRGVIVQDSALISLSGRHLRWNFGNWTDPTVGCGRLGFDSRNSGSQRGQAGGGTSLLMFFP